MDTDAQNKSATRRSWHSVFSPFSTSALRSLPDTSHRNRDRELRADRIPETNDVHAHETIIRDYQSTNNDANTSSAPISVRVPKKIATPIKVEGKVWFANERSKLLRSHRTLHHTDTLSPSSLAVLPERWHANWNTRTCFVQRF